MSRALLVAIMSVGAPACGMDSVSDFDDVVDIARESPRTTYTGPRKRTAHAAQVRCFESHGKFKRAMAKEGHESRFKKTEWHHIVGQHSANKAKFGEYDLHCTDNVVLIDYDHHKALNTYYTKTRDELGGKSLRDWLKSRDFDEQYTHGTIVLNKLEVEWKLVE